MSVSVAVRHERRSPALRSVPPAKPKQEPRRRVRQEARDALAVVAFSAGASLALALVIMLIMTMAD
jgi:hypothetical protein